MSSTNQNCKSCGNSFSGKYCNRCGEKVYNDHDKSAIHIADEVLHFVTHFEGSLPTTIKTIFTKPGKLALDYCNGIRKKYFKPISLFLLCIVLYLLFPKFDGLNMKFYSYISPQNNYTWLSKPVARNKIKSENLKLEELNEKYNKESGKVSKIFLLALLPLSALALAGLFYSKRRYFFDHFIMATEFNSVMVIIIFLLLPLILVASSLVFPNTDQVINDENIGMVIFVYLILLSFLSIALKRFYQQNWLLTILKSAAFLVIFNLGIMYVYHCLSFLIVMLLI